MYTAMDYMIRGGIAAVIGAVVGVVVIILFHKFLKK